MHPPWASLLVGPISSSRASLWAGGRPSCTSRRRLEGGRAGAEQPPLATCTRGGAARELWTAAPRPFDAVGWPQPQRRSPRLKSAFGSRGVVTKTRAPFPNHSHIGLPLQVGAERHGLTDKTFIRVCVCARRMTRASAPPCARAKTSERGEQCRADTRFRHAQRASRTALDAGREGGCPAPSGCLLSPGRAVHLGRPPVRHHTRK